MILERGNESGLLAYLLVLQKIRNQPVSGSIPASEISVISMNPIFWASE
jgi:hypothetical protein